MDNDYLHVYLDLEPEAAALRRELESVDKDRTEWVRRACELEALLRKIVLCFPDTITEESVEFNIPAYVIEEARDAVKEKP